MGIFLLLAAMDHRVSEHKVDETTQKTSVPDPKLDRGAFAPIVQTALTEIKDDPIHNAPYSRSGKDFIQMASILLVTTTALSHVMADHFGDLLSAAKITNQSGREDLMRSFAGIMTQGILQAEFAATVASVLPDPFHAALFRFCNELCLKMFRILLEKYRELVVVTGEETTDSTLSDNDNSVIMYITGAMMRSLASRCRRFSKNKKWLLCGEMLPTWQIPVASSGSDVDKYAVWCKALDRGGLKRPCRSLFLMMRAVETVVRKNIGGGIHAHAIRKDRLTEVIMDDPLVSHYWDLLTTTALSKPTLVAMLFDELIQYTLTVRGFALARKVREQLLKKGPSKQKALRKALKDLGNKN